MLDKLAFQKTLLKDNVTLYRQDTPLPITHIRIMVPIGTAHSHPDNAGFRYGCAHFLEHMCFERSEHYQDKSAFEKLIAESGAKQNAWTDSYFTEYYLEAPAETATAVLPAFLDHVFSPHLHEDDIAIERGIIKNERDQRKYYPGSDELSQYRYSSWQRSSYYPKDQIYGADDDLAAMTPELLRHVHSYYHTLPIEVFIGGTVTDVILEQLTTHIPDRLPASTPLSTRIDTLTWGQREYHTFVCKDISDPVYHCGNLSTHNTPERLCALSFILDMLCESESGSLQKWIRKEKGWSYGVYTEMTSDKHRLGWEITIPLSDHTVTDTIRQELPGRIKQTIQDKDLFEQTKRRVALQSCFNFETLSSRIDTVTGTFRVYDTLLTEKRFADWLEALTLEEIEQMHAELFTFETAGEFLAVPPIV